MIVLNKSSFMRLLYILILFLFACKSAKKVDIIVTNGVIYTVDNHFSTAESMAIENGKIVATGSI
jgi:hypothetical protein